VSLCGIKREAVEGLDAGAVVNTLSRCRMLRGGAGKQRFSVEFLARSSEWLTLSSSPTSSISRILLAMF
jgi:hypothetical protein